MEQYHLFMVLLGCKPKGRNTEQHDVFFGIAKELKELVPQIKNFWKGASPIHIDGWRVIENTDGFKITVSENSSVKNKSAGLFFLNLGGYKENQFEEFHYKMLIVAKDKAKAAANAKRSAFFLHTGFGKDAAAHIDDRYGVAVDDFFEIKDILPDEIRSRFSVTIAKNTDPALPADKIHLGYFKLDSL